MRNMQSGGVQGLELSTAGLKWVKQITYINNYIHFEV